MRDFIRFAVILTLAGCAPAATVSKEVAGPHTYTLLAVDHMAVPEAPVTGPLAGQEIIGGELDLKANGTFEMGIRGRAQMSTLEPLPFSRVTAGTFTASNIGVTLTSTDNVVRDGAFFGKTLRIYVDGIEYLFIQKGLITSADAFGE